MPRRSFAIAFAAAIALTTPAYAQTPPAKQATTAKGPALVDGKGMTLYTFTRDANGLSACNGQCATNWPPFLAPSDAKDSGDWSAIKRDDGSRQWAYKGKPLYTWVKDSKPGDATGDKVQNTWDIARP